MKIAIERRHLVLVALLPALIVGISVWWLMSRAERIDRSVPLQLTQPLYLDESSEGASFLLPPGTVLYHQESYAEGHGRYWIELFYKGQLPATRLSPEEAYATMNWGFALEDDRSTLAETQ